MALTPAEQKKMKKIEALIAEKQKEHEALKLKSAEDFANQAIKYDLWKLDKKTIEAEFKALANKYKVA